MTAKITVSIRLAVAPQRAFELFTQDVDRWWQRGPKYRFQANRGGALAFEPGEGGRFVERYGEGEPFEVGRILIWQPGERLRFTWRLPNFTPEQSTEVDIRFQPVAEGTRLTLDHFGWNTLPPGHPARHGLANGPFFLLHARWWDDQLERLRDSPRT